MTNGPGMINWERVDQANEAIFQRLLRIIQGEDMSPNELEKQLKTHQEVVKSHRNRISREQAFLIAKKRVEERLKREPEPDGRSNL